MGTFVEKIRMPLMVFIAGLCVAVVLLLENAFIAELKVLVYPNASLQATCTKDGPAIVAGTGTWTSYIAPDGQRMYAITHGYGDELLISDEVNARCLSNLWSALAGETFVQAMRDPLGPWRQAA